MGHNQEIGEHSKAAFQHVADNTKYMELVHSGEDYFMRLKKIIDNAEKEIHLQTYIFQNDETGNSIAACLKMMLSQISNGQILGS